MDRSNVIKLISSTRQQDDYGVWQETLEERSVYCNVQSVSQSEFFEGGRNGLNPEYKFTVFFGDYDGETLVEYEGLTYAVYRTYQKRNDTLELYVERKGGVNGKTVQESGSDQSGVSSEGSSG